VPFDNSGLLLVLILLFHVLPHHMVLLLSYSLLWTVHFHDWVLSSNVSRLPRSPCLPKILSRLYSSPSSLLNMQTLAGIPPLPCLPFFCYLRIKLSFLVDGSLLTQVCRLPPMSLTQLLAYAKLSLFARLSLFHALGTTYSGPLGPSFARLFLDVLPP